MELKPTNFSTKEIANIAEKFALDKSFYPGDSVEAFVFRLNGRVYYLPPMKGGDFSLMVFGPEDFEVRISSCGIERDRFSIAHEIGHYVLHTDCGKIKGNATRFMQESKSKIEREANIFAACLIMPTGHFLEKCKVFNNNVFNIANAYLVMPYVVDLRKDIIKELENE